MPAGGGNRLRELRRAEGRPSARAAWALAALAGALLLAPALALAQAGADSLGARAATDTLGARADSSGRARAATDSLAAVAAPESAVGGPIEDLWVLRNSLERREDLPLLVERARAMHVRRLLVQVVGRGDAWYRSDRLPYPEPLPEPGRDPLGELLPLAHAAGLEVHAWVNCCLVWSAPKRPRDPRHVVNAHPEWIARLKDGRSMARLSEGARRKLHVEGIFLSPANPGVRRWVAANAAEIARRYPVDGIHLDYIRQPGIDVGYDPTSRARFALEHGVDPARIGRLRGADRATADSLWGEFQLEQVTAIVREVRDSLSAVRPGLPLSAAVLGDTLVAERRNRQAWLPWLRDGLLDRAYPMCYAPEVQTVLAQLEGLAPQPGAGRLVPGIAVYNTSPSIAAAKIKGALALGFRAIALYSYDSLWERDDQWSRLEEFLNGPRTLEVKP